MNLSQLIADQSARYGDKAFLLYDRQPEWENRVEPFRQVLSYRQLDAEVNRACHYLSSLGVRPGDVLNLHLPNCPAFVILWFAIARLGAVMMPTNVLSSTEELAYLLGHSESKLSFTTAENLDAIEQSKQGLGPLKQVILCDPHGEQPQPDSFEAILGEQIDKPWHCPAAESDMAAIMYTSGTTSKPKGVMVTHANYLTAGNTVADAVDLRETDRHMTVLPLFHGNAQYYSTMSALLRGASIALMDRFSASQYFDKCIEYRCSVASLFAAPMRMILAQPPRADHRENELRIVIYAQNLTDQQMQEWHQRFHAPLCQIWGMTETMGPPLMNPLLGERRNRTVGKPTGGYEVVLVDDAGEPVDTGVEGEITVKGVPGKTIMAGYFRNPEATANAIRDNRLHTGDNAVMDEAGFFRFVDRKKDMIKRSGENVSAGEVEYVILQHSAVFECAVVGVPDEMRDEAIVAVVVLREGQSASESELIEFCAGRLATFRVPQRVVFESGLPKTSVGKIQKHLIRRDLMSAG